MQEYMDKLHDALREVSECPVNMRTIEQATAIAGLLKTLDIVETKRTAEKEAERAEIEMWMQHMKNDDPDKPTGPMWSEAECLAFASSAGIDLSGIPGYVFWAAMNMEWSDGWGVARDFGVDQPQYYARRAEAFLRDKDGGGAMRKISAYYRCVVEQ